MRSSFNPRTRVGCDPCVSLSPVVPKMFQSTHPRGVRLQFTLVSADDTVFQSTHPRGVRLGVRFGNFPSL